MNAVTTTPGAPPAAPGPSGPAAPDALGHPAIPLTIGDPEPVAPAAAPSAEQQRLAELEQQLQQQGSQMQQMLQAMTQMATRGAQPVPAAPAAPAFPDFSLEGLPDPISKPTEFTKQLQQAIGQREAALTQHLTTNLTHNITSQLTKAQALDRCYDRFTAAHPDLARYSTLLQGAFLAESNNYRQHGIDPLDVAAQNPDSLIANIAQRMRAELGVTAPAAAAGVSHGQPLTPFAPPTHGAARTQGIAGGSAPTAPAPVAPAPAGFTAQLNAQRQRDGLI